MLLGWRISYLLSRALAASLRPLARPSPISACFSTYHPNIRKPQNIFSAKDDTPPGWRCWCPWDQKPQGRRTERHLPLKQFMTKNTSLKLSTFMLCCVTYLNIRHDEFLDARLLKTASCITVLDSASTLAPTSQYHTCHLSWSNYWRARLKKHHSFIQDV